MTIWLVIEDDYDCTRIMAAYPSSELAEEHALVKGLRVEDVEILSELPAEVKDSLEKKRARAAKKESDIKDVDAYMKQTMDAARRGRTFNPEEFLKAGGNISLCHCSIFSARRAYNPYGYCTYCGGVDPEVFRQLRGEAALQEEISKLAEHDRIRMQQIVGSK